VHYPAALATQLTTA
jgi:chromosome segregation ATPase